MATFVNGTNMVLKLDDTATAGTASTPSATAIGAATSCTLSVTIDTPECTVKGEGDHKSNVGLSTSWTVDAEMFYNEDETVDFASMFAPAYGVSTAAGVSPVEANYPRRVYVEFLGNTGGNKYTGYGYISSISMTGGTEDGATASVSITGDGVLPYAAS